MTVVLITGSTEGLGKATAVALLDGGHDVIVHARNAERSGVLRPLLKRGAAAVVGDLSDLDEVREIAHRLGNFSAIDAVIHNAGS